MKKLLLFLALAATSAQALPLSTIGTFCSTFPDQCRKGTQALLVVRGIGTDAYYVVEADVTTGALPAPTPASPTGRAYADSVRNAYASVNVTTGAWVQLIASTAAAINNITLFDSCGETLELGTGAALSEARKLIIPPGGIDGVVPLAIAAGTRVAVRAVSGNCTSGELDITGLN